jgi:hypothetical protein
VIKGVMRKHGQNQRNQGRKGLEGSQIRILSVSTNPKGRVPRAMPVGECEGGDMVCLGHGNPSIWPWSLPNGVSRCVDPEISPPYPESWSARLLEETFPESHEEFAGM